MGRNQSEKARKEIEREFGLVHAQQQQKADYNLKPVNALKVQYGKAETKRAVTNVLDYVLPKMNSHLKPSIPVLISERFNF